MKKITSNHSFGIFLILMTFVFGSNFAKAQLTGLKNIPGDYADLTTAVADLNLQGVGAGGVTFNLVAGNPQTAPVGGYSITASGTVTDQITFTGNANTITTPAQTAGQLFDGIIKIVGGDFITIQGFVLNENAANTTTVAVTNNMTEWGIALLYATTTNGCQNIAILNNTIALGATYQNAFGVYANSTHASGTPTTTASATTVSGGNNNLSIKGNTISSVNMGIVVVGPTAAADQNDVVMIGGTTALEGNTITFGLSGTISAFANVSGTVNGILVRNSKNVTVSRNNLTSSGTVTAGTLNGIQFPAFSTAPTGTFTQNVNNNSISLRSNVLAGAINGIQLNGTSASILSSVNVNDNNFFNFDHITATASGAVTFINQSGLHLNTTIQNNTFTNITLKTTGSVTFITNNWTAPTGATKNVNNNSIVTQFTKTGAGGTVTCFTDNGSDPLGNINNSNNNNFSNITVNGATTVLGISNTNGGAPTKSVLNNTVSNWTGGTSLMTGLSVAFSGNSTVSGNTISNFASSGQITGINSSSGTLENFVNNTVHSLSTSGAFAVTGIAAAGGTTKNISRNKIYNLSSINAAGSVNGILVLAGTTTNLTNNVIGDLRAPLANAANPVNGINISGGTTVVANYNTVYLNATSSGALFGSSAILASTTPNVTLSNNMFINNSTPTGTGNTVAYRRTGTTLTAYNVLSNRNSFFAGTPGANNLLFFDGTTGDQTFGAYQLRLLLASVTADANSFSESQPYATTYFTSLVGSFVDYLKPAAATITLAESGASNIAGITVDYANVIRQGNAGYAGTGTAPDCGAFEFEGTSPAPVVVINSIIPSGNQCVNATRLVSANVTTSSGTISSATLGYAINGTAQAPIAMTNTAGTTWEATIPVVVPTNATITWFVSATNSIGLTSSLFGTPYADEPLTGVTGNAIASLTTVCAGSPSSLSSTLALNGAGPVGISGVASSNFPDVPLNHAYGGAKTQYIYRASELIAAGFSAGNITNLSYNVTAIGTTPMNGFTIDMGNTVQNSAVANVAITSGLTNVYTNAAQAVTLGANNFSLSTPFAWDGTSNIVVSFVYSNNNAGGTSSTITSSTASFVSTMGIRADNTIASCLYGAVASTDACVNLTNTNATSSIRPLITFTGNRAPAITSVTWMNGATTVGTGNPLVVNPTVTATYTANITAAGCILSASPTVLVNVNPVNVVLTPINISCNGLSDGSFSLGTVTCGVAPFTYSVDAGAFGSIPTNLTLGAHSIIVKDAGGFDSAPIMITITQPGAVGTPIIPTNATVCQNNGSAQINATNSGTIVLTIPLSAAGDEINVVPGNVIGTSTYAAIPAGTTVTSATLTVNGMIPNGNDYQTDVKLGFSGAINDPATLASSGTGLVGAGTVSGVSYNYTRPITPGLINPAGGAFSVLYWNDFEDVAGAADATFPATATVTINYSGTGVFSSLSWWTAASGGTNLGTTSPFETVGTSVLPTTATPGTYTFYAQGQNGACNSPSRLPVTVTVNSNSSSAFAQSACSSYTWAQTGISYTVSGTYKDTIPNALGCDSIITLNLTINLPSTASVSQTSCSSYTWPISGLTYTVSGAYNDTITNAAGCDSIITLNLTINQASASSVSQTACVTYTWAQNGVTYTTSGAYTDTIPNAIGCDSIITLNLVINQPTSSSVSEAACVTYTWAQNGMTYTTSGAYTDTILNVAGCDSIITLNLVINLPTASSVSASACATYTWAQNGVTYIASGAYTDTIPNAAGCDSIITLNLVINQPTASSVSASACATYTWAQNGATYTASGAYTDTITNAVGCDSIITLNLIINQPTASSVSASACVTYTWAQNGTTYTTSGAYNDTIPNAAGCDSIITLNLIINQPTVSSVSASACVTYTWAQNGTTYTTSGAYNDTIPNAAGCDSIITLNLTINALPVAAVSPTSVIELTATTTGVTYQWINCVSNTPVAGANTAVFTATSNGEYAVVVTNPAGCSDTSACTVISQVSIDENVFVDLSLVPNPTYGMVKVLMSEEQASLTITDAQGRFVTKSSVSNNQMVDISNEVPGVYFFTLQTNGVSKVIRIVKQ